MFPNSQRINRGNYEVKQLVDACRANDVTDLILLHEHRGVPGKIHFFILTCTFDQIWAQLFKASLA